MYIFLYYLSDSTLPNDKYKQIPRVVVPIFISNPYNATMQHGDQHYRGLVVLLHHKISRLVLMNEIQQHECYHFTMMCEDIPFESARS